MNVIKMCCCKIGWHSLTYDWLSELTGNPYIPNVAKAKCKWCGTVGLVDSHGNLF